MTLSKLFNRTSLKNCKTSIKKWSMRNNSRHGMAQRINTWQMLLREESSNSTKSSRNLERATKASEKSLTENQSYTSWEMCWLLNTVNNLQASSQYSRPSTARIWLCSVWRTILLRQLDSVRKWWVITDTYFPEICRWLSRTTCLRIRANIRNQWKRLVLLTTHLSTEECRPREMKRRSPYSSA